jgi:hypothetical protein
MHGLSEERRSHFQDRNGKGDRLMMMTAEEKLTAEEIRYLKVAISLALTGPDIQEKPKTKLAFNELYDKIERIQGNKDQLLRGRLN